MTTNKGVYHKKILIILKCKQKSWRKKKPIKLNPRKQYSQNMHCVRNQQYAHKLQNSWSDSITLKSKSQNTLQSDTEKNIKLKIEIERMEFTEMEQRIGVKDDVDNDQTPKEHSRINQFPPNSTMQTQSTEGINQHNLQTSHRLFQLNSAKIK